MYMTGFFYYCICFNGIQIININVCILQHLRQAVYIWDHNHNTRQQTIYTKI